MASPLFDDSALKAQVRKLDDLPRDEAHVGAVAKQGGDVGVEAAGEAYVGKGWSVGGTFAWMKQAGWSAVGGFNWKGKPK